MASSETGLKLLGVQLSPFVARVMMALKLKGIDYELVHENLPNKSQLLLKSNPVHQKIPVLIHHGKPICESLVILHYLEETWPCSPYSLLPSDPYDRAIVRFWAAFIDDKLVVSLRKIFTTPDKEAQAKGTEEAKENVAVLEGALRSVGKGKTYFGGDNVGLLDLAFGCLYGMIKATETVAEVSLINEGAAPGLTALLQALRGNPAVKDFLPDPVIIADYYRKRFLSQQQQPQP